MESRAGGTNQLSDHTDDNNLFNWGCPRLEDMQSSQPLGNYDISS